jgi:hypothetical protein
MVVNWMLSDLRRSFRMNVSNIRGKMTQIVDLFEWFDDAIPVLEVCGARAGG